MKIAVTATGQTIDDQIDRRFGRCPCFLVIDPDTMEVEAVENPNLVLGGGAGIQSAQLMAEHDVRVVLTGNCGPNACQTLNAAGIKIILGVSGTVRGAVEQFKAGDLATTQSPNVASHFGTGGGGRGMGMAPSIEPTPIRTATPGLVAAVDAEECTGCGLCTEVCPTEAITIDSVALVDAAKCTGCGQCVTECPQDALTLKKGQRPIGL